MSCFASLSPWHKLAIRAVIAAAAIFSASPSTATAAEGFFFQDGDRVLFIGDSITEQYQYSTDIELYLTTRFPKWRLQFLNAGISGDTAGGGAGRFKTHVLDEKPTAVTINFGMNDGGYGAFNKDSNARYVKNTESMLEAAKNAGIRVALVSPNAVDRRLQERFKLYLETQKEFYAPLASSAEKFGFPFVDQYATTRAALEKMEADKADAVRPFGDGFHTSSNGGLFMAHAILTGLHAPALVSDATIDVTSGKATGKACTVTGVSGDPQAVEFTRLDDALPLPIQKDWVSLLPYMNNLKDLNWYGLKVTGLAAGNYAVAIDGEEVAQFTADELAAGVNLGNVTQGPIHAQGKIVLDAMNAKNQLVHQRFRSVVMFNAPDWLAEVAAAPKAAELAKRMEKIAAAQAAIYEAVQPVKHNFAIKALK
ncbi:Esterase TesA precursor [Anatilimnocola aggregata]|uniref:Esterase TesA n=1 Tax=Anatilimnocola aggregata TaxID=2528021 RepID=A0A517YD04_9BACT|nr:SGNH/GDSL hydrolase family protein [Anatilimnocola aggregata]QDU28124.1 Esterase TesA precursor [Anatilimnocola aggregata]